MIIIGRNADFSESSSSVSISESTMRNSSDALLYFYYKKRVFFLSIYLDDFDDEEFMRFENYENLSWLIIGLILDSLGVFYVF